MVQGTTSGTCVRDGKVCWFSGFLEKNCGGDKGSAFSTVLHHHSPFGGGGGKEMHRRRLGPSLAGWRWRLVGATHTRGIFVCNEARRDGLLQVAGFGV